VSPFLIGLEQFKQINASSGKIFFMG